MNLNGKLRKKLGGQAKIWGGHGPPRPPLRIATAYKTSFKIAGFRTTLATNIHVSLPFFCKKLEFMFGKSIAFNLYAWVEHPQAIITLRFSVQLPTMHLSLGKRKKIHSWLLLLKSKANRKHLLRKTFRLFNFIAPFPLDRVAMTAATRGLKIPHRKKP